MIPQHEISVVAAGRRIPGWTAYSISQDMLSPADGFSLALRFAREAWDLVHRDQLVTVYVDEVPIVTGYVDARRKVPGRAGTMMEVTGRDKGGRLVDESCPLFAYGGLHLKELAERICGIGSDAEPLFEGVTLVNTRNRSLLRRVRAAQAKIVREPFIGGQTLRRPPPLLVPAIPPTLPKLSAQTPPGTRFAPRFERTTVIDPGIFGGRAAPKRVHPGTSRWAVLEEFLVEARLIAWSSGDGRELFVGLPNYEQQIQYWFYEAGGAAARRAETNCEITVTESNADRYSMITCMGASAGGDFDYADGATKRRAIVYDNPQNTSDGTGLSFRRRKALIVTDDSVSGARDLRERAERERLERDAHELEVEVIAPGHGQRYRGDRPTLFTIDTMARVEDEDTGTRGDFLVVACEYTGGTGQPTQTRLRLVPRGTVLSL